MNKTRLEAFSDGVLAIIITIMVLEIKMPRTDDWESLLSLRHVFTSYLLSFVFIGIYWGNHHHLVHTVKSVTAGIIWANMNLLFWLSLIPLATNWMGGNNFATNTVVVYAVLLLLCGVSYNILQITIEKGNHISEEMLAAFRKVKRKGFISAAGYTAAIPTAFVSTTASSLLFIAISILWIIPDRSIARAFREK